MPAGGPGGNHSLSWLSLPFGTWKFSHSLHFSEGAEPPRRELGGEERVGFLRTDDKSCPLRTITLHGSGRYRGSHLWCSVRTRPQKPSQPFWLRIRTWPRDGGEQGRAARSSARSHWWSSSSSSLAPAAVSPALPWGWAGEGWGPWPVGTKLMGMAPARASG